MKTYRVGIIGLGLIFPSHAFPLHLLEQTEVVAVCDIKPEANQRAEDLYHLKAYTDYKEMLKREDIDVVHILTPHYLHAPMAIDALNAGKHVLTEKPMSIGYEEACAMVEAAQRNNVTLGVISQNRYNAASIAIKEAISSGSLGKVIGQRVIIPGTKPMYYYRNSDWRGTWDKEGGSLVIDVAVHILDLARWFLDEEIESVQATMANRDHPEIEVEDTAEGLITFKNGVRSVFYATNNYTYNAPSIVETQCEEGIALLEFDKAIITYKNGQERVVVHDPTVETNAAKYKEFLGVDMRAAAFRTLHDWGVIFSGIQWKGGGGGGVSHYTQIKNYYESLAAGVQPDINGEVAIKTQQMISAIYQSAKEGRTIRF